MIRGGGRCCEPNVSCFGPGATRTARPYAALNADPEVRRWLAGTLTRAESDTQLERLQANIEAHGFGFWAVEAPGLAPFIGFVGLQRVPFDAPFTPAVEIGWRLARAFWTQGFATEAARAALAHGFGPLDLTEIVAITVPDNHPSRRVMARIGMTRDPDGDFDHPGLAAGHSLQRHVLHRIARGGEPWRARRDSHNPQLTSSRRRSSPTTAKHL